MPSTNIIDFIQAAIEEKPLSAFDSFSNEMNDRVTDLLSVKSNEIRDNMFNGEVTEATTRNDKGKECKLPNATTVKVAAEWIKRSVNGTVEGAVKKYDLCKADEDKLRALVKEDTTNEDNE